MPRVKSKSRNYFEKLSATKAKCKICDKTLSTGGGTSNMLTHLSRRHKMDLTKNNDKPHNISMDYEVRKYSSNSENYIKAKQCCIDLIKVHGRPVELLDDESFRKLLSLIPMSKEKRKLLCSRSIEKVIERLVCQEKEEENNDNFERTSNTSMDETNQSCTMKAAAVEIECNCKNDLSEYDDASRHQHSCPAAANQPYWNYFQVSIDVATCLTCKDTISWSDISVLKEHLKNSHPNHKYVDDDSNFQQKCASSSTASHDDIQEVFLDESMPESKPQDIGKPKKITLHQTSVNASSERLKSLDRFGLYIASLMKLIPLDKCLKFQVQIVERLIQEQAAAA